MDQEIKKYSFKEGFYLGFTLILIITFFYFLDSKILTTQFNIYSCVFILLLLLFPIISIYKYNFTDSKAIFKNYFSICFLVMCTSLFYVTCYFYLLYNFIDHNLIQEYVETKYLQCFSNPDCNISFEDYLALYKNDYFSLSGQFNAYVFSLIPCTLYASIISLLIKMMKST